MSWGPRDRLSAQVGPVRARPGHDGRSRPERRRRALRRRRGRRARGAQRRSTFRRQPSTTLPPTRWLAPSTSQTTMTFPAVSIARCGCGRSPPARRTAVHSPSPTRDRRSRPRRTDRRRATPSARRPRYDLSLAELQAFGFAFHTLTTALDTRTLTSSRPTAPPQHLVRTFSSLRRAPVARSAYAPPAAPARAGPSRARGPSATPRWRPPEACRATRSHNVSAISCSRHSSRTLRSPRRPPSTISAFCSGNHLRRSLFSLTRPTPKSHEQPSPKPTSSGNRQRTTGVQVRRSRVRCSRI